MISKSSLNPIHIVIKFVAAPQLLDKQLLEIVREITSGVFAVEFFENVDLELGSFPVLVDALDDLDGDLWPLSSVDAVMIDDLCYFAERSFAQMTKYFVPVYFHFYKSNRIDSILKRLII